MVFVNINLLEAWVLKSSHNQKTEHLILYGIINKRYSPQLWDDRYYTTQGLHLIWLQSIIIIGQNTIMKVLEQSKWCAIESDTVLLVD
jgi:hypothetical protein